MAIIPAGTPIPMAILSDVDKPALVLEDSLLSTTVAPELEIMVPLLIFDEELARVGFNDLETAVAIWIIESSRRSLTVHIFRPYSKVGTINLMGQSHLWLLPRGLIQKHPQVLRAATFDDLLQYRNPATKVPVGPLSGDKVEKLYR